MSDPSNKDLSAPIRQQAQDSDSENSTATSSHDTNSSTKPSHAELIEQARGFLKDDSIQNAPRERKVAFLQQKGLKDSDIEELLEEAPATPANDHSEELKTIHDSTKDDINTKSPAESPEKAPSQPSSSSPTASTPPKPAPQRDLPPIITYPEFLLKPQKPPPLITVDRLFNAAYAFAGVSTLVYSASKYIIEPMLENLTEARHSLASTTIADLEQLNQKLESSVSHIPYIASAAARKSQDQQRDEDNESTTSDPTELFHRDIATQTTPSLSRTQSYDASKEHLDPTTQQVMRLSSLHDTLTSLVVALDPKEVPYLPPTPNKKLRDTIADFQNVLDKLETAYNPLRGEYYSNIYAQPADNKKVKEAKENDVAARVRTEIRSLKGAFLSARNFPTAPRPANAYGISR